MPNNFCNKKFLPKSLTGNIERIIFYSETTGFFVIKAKIKDYQNLVTITGNSPSIIVGEHIECQGTWFNNITYGMQFKTHHIKTIIPTTKKGIEKYLSSGMIRGIGVKFAKRLVNFFGSSVLEIVENHPEKLIELPGIGKKRQQKITTALAEQRIIRDIVIFLQSHGIGIDRAIKIYKIYGNKAIKKIQENPYQLALDIYGIGFKTADQIAQSIGINPHSLIRAQAGIRHVLLTLSEKGHCAEYKKSLIQQTHKLLSIPKTIIQEAIRIELATHHLISQDVNKKDTWLFPTHLALAEQGVAQHLKRLLIGSPPWGELALNTEILFIEKLNKMKLSFSQRTAIKRTLNNKVSIITGGPGVGKTTVINGILHIVQTRGIQTMLCAPTGRSAKKLSESTGHPATTIHRLLEFDSRLFNFKRNTENPLDTTFLIIDELSMVDILLMNKLLCAIPNHAALLLVGDVDQFPSIGPGYVLSDIINSHKITVSRLTEIFRQSSNSNITINAHAINAGHMPDITNEKTNDFFFITAESSEEIKKKLLNIVLYRLPTRFGFDPVKDIQILTPMNRGEIGTHSLNNILQIQLNKNIYPKVAYHGQTFLQGDKIIQKINNYDKDIFNGDIGIIKLIDKDNAKVFIQFDNRKVYYYFNELDEISLAYAMTIHKSQGSEYPCVIIPLSIQNYLMLERNLIYTGITRGKKIVVIIGQKKALAIAIRTFSSRKRKTWLKERLKIL